MEVVAIRGESRWWLLNTIQHRSEWSVPGGSRQAGRKAGLLLSEAGSALAALLPCSPNDLTSLGV